LTETAFSAFKLLVGQQEGNPVNADWFYLSGAGLPRLSWKKGC